MKITSVDIYKVETDDPKLKAYASVVLDDCFAIRGIRILEAKNGLVAAMPNRKKANGKHVDLAHPINTETRKMFTDTIIEAYKKES